MRQGVALLSIAAVLWAFPYQPSMLSAGDDSSIRGKGQRGNQGEDSGCREDSGRNRYGQNVQLGPRPFYLVDKMSPGPLKRTLQQCNEDSFDQTDFSIGHRGGAPLLIPGTPRKVMKQAHTWALVFLSVT